MRPIIFIILTVLLLVFPTQGYAYYKWYDENGSVHYTQADPPPDAKNEDGSSWWEDEPESEETDLDRKQKIEQARLKIKNGSPPEQKLNSQPSPIEEDDAEASDEEEPRADHNERFSIPSFSLFKWWDSTRVDPGEPSVTLHGVWGSSTDDVFVVGTSKGIPEWHKRFLGRGGIFHFDGKKWSEMSSPDDEFLDEIALYGVWGSSSSDVYAVGSEWTVLYYDGVEWNQVETGLYEIPDPRIDMESSPLDGFWSVWGSSAYDIYAVGMSLTRRGVVLHFDGYSWHQIDLPETDEGKRDLYRCVWGTSADNVFILGAMGRVYHYDGDTWERTDLGQSVELGTIGGNSDNGIFAAGHNGMIYHYDGEEWSQVLEAEGTRFRGIWGSSPDDVYASGSSYEVGAIFHYNGTKWKRIKIVKHDHLNGIWGDNNGDVIAVGTRGKILHFSSMPIFLLALGAVAFGLWILGWRFIRKKRR